VLAKECLTLQPQLPRAASADPDGGKWRIIDHWTAAKMSREDGITSSI
jgi:hypothetical protein